VERNRKQCSVLVLSAFAVVVAVSGCNQLPVDSTVLTGTGGGGAGTPHPIPTPTVTATPVPVGTPTPVPTPVPTPPGGTTTSSQCVSSDANHICIGLKLVSYQDGNGVTSLNRAQADTLVQGINNIWKTCNIAFQMEQYDSVDPTTVGLTYGGGSESELTAIRREFSDSSTFLVAIPGPWSGKTIAWTTMPGGGPFGTIVEAQYGTNPMTVGHELGHYQGLYHISDYTNLMNPYIGSNTSALTSNQCDIARQTDQTDWQRMLRK
jgi:hypothetical protein